MNLNFTCIRTLVFTAFSILSQLPCTAQFTDPDFRTGITRTAPTSGTGWISQPFTIGAGNAQTFSNWKGSGVNVTFTYSNNMWDANSPNIYVPAGATGAYPEPPNDPHPASVYHGAMRITNNTSDTGGAAGSPTGPTLIEITFDQPVNLTKLRIGSISQIMQLSGNLRNEWARVRILDNATVIPLVVGDATYGIIDETGAVAPGDMNILPDGSGGLILGAGDGDTSVATGPVQNGGGVNTYGHIDIAKSGNVTKIQIEHWANNNADPASTTKRTGLASIIVNQLAVAPVSAPCAITDITMTGGAGTCNDNGTPLVTTDDWFLSAVTVTFSDAPATGNLVLSGAALHSSNTVTTVAVGSTTSSTSHTFVGVKLKANNTANALTATFDADSACTLTENTAAVPPCSACPTITVTPNPLSSGTVGTAYTGSPSAGGGTAPYTWTATSLPAGLSISPSTGAITGNPTATGTATITATDANGCTGTTSLTINPFACPTITVTPAILPEASVGQPYSETPTASGAGGGASYGWSATSLPAGLSINPTTGLISGTPTAEGTATITATYTGPGGELCTGTATLSIVNNCCPQLIFAVP